jgi:hypothetical protein
MASADFSNRRPVSLQALLLLKEISATWLEISPGKSNSLHLIYLPHLLLEVRVVLDFVLYSKLVRL